MSAARAIPLPAGGTKRKPRPEEYAINNISGTVGMWLFIATEASLFVVLFFAYFYLGSFAPRWPLGEPPKVMLALVMLGLLAASSAVLHGGERALKRGSTTKARAYLIGTILMGAAFLGLQVAEYSDHLKTLQPQADAYGSIFYAITSLHGLHLILGLLMLTYVLFLPLLEPVDRTPHRPYHNAALYWHFVDAVWFVVVGLLYLLPRVQV